MPDEIKLHDWEVWGWRLQAACVGEDPELFTTHNGRPLTARVETARGICRGCPVQTDCLADAFATGDWGRFTEMRGGYTGMERLNMRRAIREAS